jgi:hypothetical protein
MYGVLSYYSTGAAEVIGNDINIPGYAPLMLAYTEGDIKKRPLVANNMLRIGKTVGTAGYGVYLVNSGFVRLVNNTFVSTHSSYTYYAIYLSGGLNSVMNNIIQDRNTPTTSYYTYYVGSSFALAESDYNNFYTNKTMGYLLGAYASLSAWQTGTGFDQHSLSVNPNFTNSDSLRTCNDSLEGAGTPVSYVMDDFDGDGRHPVTPDIGADEWVGGKPGSFSAGLDGYICNDEPVTIGLPANGSTFLWNTFDTTATISVNVPGTYTVDMTSSCGNQHSDTVEVFDNTPTSVFTIMASYHSGKFTNNSQNGDSYMWVVHTNPPDTFYSKDLNYLFQDNGPYAVDLYVYNDCDTVMSTQQWSGFVGLPAIELSDLVSVMPNPASDVMTIRFNGLEGDVQVEMSNAQGQVVFRDNYMDVSGSSAHTIDVSSLNKGMYIVRFTTDNDVMSKQIVVQ